MKNAFTMMELIFVIVVLGILAGIAVPKLAVTRDDATVAKIRGDLAAIRTGLALKRAENQLKGQTGWPELDLSKSDPFSDILQQSIAVKTGDVRNGWKKGTKNTIDACVANKCATFTYYQTKKDADTAGVNIGTFDCDHSKDECKRFAE